MQFIGDFWWIWLITLLISGFFSFREGVGMIMAIPMALLCALVGMSFSEGRRSRKEPLSSASTSEIVGSPWPFFISFLFFIASIVFLVMGLMHKYGS